jgi:hypothetical protein
MAGVAIWLPVLQIVVTGLVLISLFIPYHVCIDLNQLDNLPGFVFRVRTSKDNDGPTSKATLRTTYRLSLIWVNDS